MDSDEDKIYDEAHYQALKYGVNYAIYQGGISGISLQFCKDRNNKVFSREEIESWRHLDFEGKPDNFDPFLCNACLGCNHSFDWISYELAIELRPDLKK